MLPDDRYRPHKHRRDRCCAEDRRELLALVAYRLDYVVASRFQHIGLNLFVSDRMSIVLLGEKTRDSNLLHPMDDPWRSDHHWDWPHICLHTYYHLGSPFRQLCLHRIVRELRRWSARLPRSNLHRTQTIVTKPSTNMGYRDLSSLKMFLSAVTRARQWPFVDRKRPPGYPYHAVRSLARRSAWYQLWRRPSQQRVCSCRSQPRWTRKNIEKVFWDES